MTNTNDQLKPSYKGTCSLKAKVWNYNDTKKDLIPVMKEMVSFSNKLLETLLVLRGEKYTLDGISYSDEDVENKLKAIKAEYKIKENFATIKKQGIELYASFCYYVNKEGDAIVNSNATGFANSFFSASEKLKVPKELQPFREYGVFPIKINGKLLEDHCHIKIKYGIARDVLIKLTSMEEISKNYEEERKSWENILLEKSETLLHLNRYNNFLCEIKKIPELSGFKQDNYKKLLNRWRDYENKDKGISRKGMRSYFMDLLNKNPTYSFCEKDRGLFGYCPQLMNLIFKDYQDLWAKEDIIGKQDGYVGIVYDCFHWKKESIGIASFKTCHVCLGDNFVTFDMYKKNEDWHIKFPNIRGSGDDHDLIICHSPQFSSSSSIEKIRVVKKDGKESKKENILFRYSGDSNKKTWYKGCIKQPIIRFSEKNNCVYIDIPISNHETTELVGDKYFSNPRDIYGFRGYFMSASTNNNRQKEKNTLCDGKFKIMGVDVGLRYPWKAAIYDVEVKNGDMKYQHVKNIESFISENCKEREDGIHKTLNRIYCVKDLLYKTMDYISGKKDEIIPFVKYNESILNIENILSIDINKYTEYLNNYRGIENKKEVYGLLKKKECGWIIPSIIHDIKEEIKKFHNEYLNTERSERGNYCRNRNHVDFSVFLKKDMVKKWISLLKSFSSFGMTPEEIKNTNGIKSKFASELSKWGKGLTRKCTTVASSMVNAARQEGVLLMFIEDLDCRTTLFEPKEKNSLKTLWGWGEIKKCLAHQAGKHNIGVVAVNPNMTSMIHYKTGLIGIEDKRNMYFFPENEKPIIIDRDENAAHNVALRGLSRHKNLRSFYADEISENKYRVICEVNDKTGGKQKSGALYHHIGSTECIMEKQEDGSLKIIKTLLTKQEKEMEKINTKSITVVLNGNIWFLMNDLREELSNKLNNYLKERICPEFIKKESEIVF